MTIGEKIKKIRTDKKLTQKELAKTANIAVGTLQQYELNKRTPQADILKRIANVLFISADELLEDVSIEVDFREHSGAKISATKLSPDIKWSDFGISFYDGKKKLTQKQKDKIAKMMQLLLEEMEESNKTNPPHES